MNDEKIIEFIGLKSKMYSITYTKMFENLEKKKLKK